MTPLRAAINEAVDSLHSLARLEPSFEAAVGLVADALASGKKLLLCGNGGSACDSAHLAAEFVVRFKEDRRPYPALSLTAEGGILTAMGNDYDFQQTFARQVEAFAQPGDVLVAFTTSGNSENIRLAIEAAHKAGAKSLAFLGRDGGRTKGMATVELLVPGTVTARIQEAHKLLLHVLCEEVEKRIPRR